MSDKEKEQKKKYTEKPWAIPKFIAEKAIKDNLSFKAVAVYKWIYDHNNHAKYLDDDPNAIFTKGSLDALYAAIRRDIDVSVRDICMELRGKGWIEPIKNAPLFKGRKQSGFICRLSKEERLLAKAIQQEMEEAAAELPENATVVESSAQGDADMGERYQFGCRFILRYHEDIDGFIDNDFVLNDAGSPLVVPLTAPARPTKTAVWVNDPEGWYEPEDIPERESEF